MKNLKKSVLILTIATGSMAFTTPVKKSINPEKSSIVWKGEKVLGTHHGTITLQEGHLVMDANGITGGKFVVDMSTINVTDLEGESKGKLEGHLKSDDFFGVKNHPTASLEITSAKKTDYGYNVAANITIKGITEPISFVLNEHEDGTMTTKLVIDRSKFDVRYGSGSFFDNLGDKTISDEFKLDVKLAF